MRQLGHREHVDEVEEQLDVRDPLMSLTAVTHEIGQCGLSHAANPARVRRHPEQAPRRGPLHRPHVAMLGLARNGEHQADLASMEALE